jgi:hypothetical protein
VREHACRVPGHLAECECPFAWPLAPRLRDATSPGLRDATSPRDLPLAKGPGSPALQSPER